MKPQSPTKLKQRKINLKLRTHLVFALTLAACVIFLAIAIRFDGLTSGLAALIAINLLGVFAAYIVTSVLKFPRDGTYREPEIRAEHSE
jgi:uncharacterized membrane protein